MSASSWLRSRPRSDKLLRVMTASMLSATTDSEQWLVRLKSVRYARRLMPMTIAARTTPTRVVIAGGGVAAIEAALALTEEAGQLVQISMLAPGPMFTYRPELVGEPFSYPPARRYFLASIARDLGIELHTDSIKWVDAGQRVVHTGAGEEISYDALLLAIGARSRPPFRHALTLAPDRLDEQLHGVIEGLEGGRVKSLAFVIPQRNSWPLPMYEFALLAAQRAHSMNVESPRITLITPEDAPLAVFGLEASRAVQALLDKHEIETITSAKCTTPRSGWLTIFPADREVGVDLVATLPELSGPSIPGIPVDAAGGFIRTDRNGLVAGLECVYAAGDLTTFPVKHGGIAAQQADSAAASIAILAGARVDPQPLVAMLCGLLWDGDQPLYLRARAAGSHGATSEVSTEPLWSPPSKINARYLGRYLETREGVATTAVTAARPVHPRGTTRMQRR